MKRAYKTRIVERDLNEHIRQENVAYREIIRKKIADEQTIGPCGETTYC